MILGFVLVGMSGWALAFLDLNVSPQHIGWSLPSHLLPDGSAFFHLLRNVGQSIYLAVSFLIIVRT